MNSRQFQIAAAGAAILSTVGVTIWKGKAIKKGASNAAKAVKQKFSKKTKVTVSDVVEDAQSDIDKAEADLKKAKADMTKSQQHIVDAQAKVNAVKEAAEKAATKQTKV